MRHNTMTVTWLFRKQQQLGNFSIENSFKELRNEWPDSSRPKWHEVNRFSHGFWERIALFYEVSLVRSSIIHITGDIYFTALAINSFRKNCSFLIATIHDIGYIHHSSRIKAWLLKYFWFTLLLKKIDHLVVVSEKTKQRVLEEASWFPEAKITVIPTVVPQHFKPRNAEPNNPKPIALHIGVAGNKNLRRHAEALQGLDVHLRIIGEPSDADHRMLKQFGVEYSTQSKLTDAEMQEAYATSDFLLFASTLEGFGMPILEAQMVGLPVITSNINPMNEVAGDGAELCDPLDSNAIRGCIECVTSDAQLREKLIQKGTANCRRFSPEESACMLHQLYKEMQNNNAHDQS